MIYIDFQKEIDAWTSEFGAEFKIDASFLPNMRFNQFYFLGPGRQAPGYDDFLLEQLTRIHKSNLTNSQKGEAFYKIVDVVSKGVKDGSIIIVELF